MTILSILTLLKGKLAEYGNDNKKNTRCWSSRTPNKILKLLIRYL